MVEALDQRTLHFCFFCAIPKRINETQSEMNGSLEAFWVSHLVLDGKAQESGVRT
jgi:hypothetical protein